ncbi:hypothetical protein AAVH_42239 [Aphelenchoides avenae]|nr:hypothetical protein AAVH_42239 [Aphelenchus avenae]
MFHVGVALLVSLVPSVLSCGEQVGLRAGILSKDPEGPRVHVHVVVYGKVYCAPEPILRIARPLKVTLDVGIRFENPSNYKLLSNATFGAGPGDLDFALSGDYSYNPYLLCPHAEPRVTVEDFCGIAALDDIKPVYERELGSKNRLLKVYDLGQIRPGAHAGPYDH